MRYLALTNSMEKNTKIYVAGHRGLAGSAIVRELILQGFTNIVTRTHEQLDLLDAAATHNFFKQEKPQVVFLAAAKVGGIYANNTFPVDFLMQNICIQTNIFQAAYQVGVDRLIFLGSSCIYPKDCPQPIKEEYLLTGPLEPTNRPYALAKIAGVEMCWSYNRQHKTKWLAAMPTNLYGPGDNYDLETAHVLPALIRKMHEAKIAGLNEVILWGSGTPRREFLYCDDLARALIYLAVLEDHKYSALTASSVCPILNIGCGLDISIAELAAVIAQEVGYAGVFVHDHTKPDGTMQKRLDVSKLSALGWSQTIPLADGIKTAYEAFLQNNLHTAA
jgi:GDP-L-fucose synthase